MALSPLNWYYVGTRTFGYKPNVFGALEAVWRLGNSAVYADGTARIPGTGSAWTWFNELSGADVTATYGTPPVNPLNMAYILGGSTSGVAPGSVAANILTPDAVYAANVMKKSATISSAWRRISRKRCPSPPSSRRSRQARWPGDAEHHERGRGQDMERNASA